MRLDQSNDVRREFDNGNVLYRSFSSPEHRINDEAKAESRYQHVSATAERLSNALALRPPLIVEVGHELRRTTAQTGIGPRPELEAVGPGIHCGIVGAFRDRDLLDNPRAARTGGHLG